MPSSIQTELINNDPPSMRELSLPPIGSLCINIHQLRDISIVKPLPNTRPQLEVVLTNRDNATFRSVFSSQTQTQLYTDSPHNTLMSCRFDETIKVPIYDASELNLVYFRVYQKKKSDFLTLSSASRSYIGACNGYAVSNLVRDGKRVNEVWLDVLNVQGLRSGGVQVSVQFQPNPEAYKAQHLDELLVKDMNAGTHGERIFTHSTNITMDQYNHALAHINTLQSDGLIEQVKTSISNLKSLPISFSMSSIPFLHVSFVRTANQLSPHRLEALSNQANPDQSVQNSQINVQSINPYSKA